MTKTILINKQNPIKESYYKKIELIDIVLDNNLTSKIEKETGLNKLKLILLSSLYIIVFWHSVWKERTVSLINYISNKFSKNSFIWFNGMILSFSDILSSLNTSFKSSIFFT